MFSAMLLHQVWRSETKGNIASQNEALAGKRGLPAAENPNLLSRARSQCQLSSSDSSNAPTERH